MHLYKILHVLSTHHQITICDEEDRNSVAQWFTGNEMVVFGPKGINVAVADYQEIEITFYRTEDQAGQISKVMKQERIPEQYQCLASGVIKIGNQGIRVMSPSDEGEVIEWDAGITLVEVWVESLRSGSKVLFLLQALPKGYIWLFERHYER